MSLIDDACCPEESAAQNCHGPVADGETLVVAVKNADHVRPGPDGGLVLATIALASKDIRGIDEGQGQRGVSFEREERAGPATLLDRMQKVTGEVDPLVGRVEARIIRKIVDAEGIRELCVHAEPTDETDKHGPSPTHGAFRARKNRKDPPTGLSWAVLRSEIAHRFRRFGHLKTGAEPVVSNPATPPAAS